MTGKGPRYRFVLVEEQGETLPVRYRHRRPRFQQWIRRTEPMEALLEALLRLSRRGEGQAAWAPSLADNPLIFLLDAMGDAVILRTRVGNMVYANPAARRMAGPASVEQLCPSPAAPLETIELADGRYERRCMTYGHGQRAVVLEVLRRIP